MGLCQSLSALRSSWRRASALAAPLQLAPPPWQYRRQTAHQQTRSNREQPVEAPQLGRPHVRLVATVIASGALFRRRLAAFARSTQRDQAASYLRAGGKLAMTD